MLQWLRTCGERIGSPNRKRGASGNMQATLFGELRCVIIDCRIHEHKRRRTRFRRRRCRQANPSRYMYCNFLRRTHTLRQRLR